MNEGPDSLTVVSSSLCVVMYVVTTADFLNVGDYPSKLYPYCNSLTRTTSARNNQPDYNYSNDASLFC